MEGATLIMSPLRALFWSLLWVLCSFSVFGFMYTQISPELGLQFLTGYIVEKSLSVDNLFVFYLIFKYFDVKLEDQAKALTYGIVGAFGFRALAILGGYELIENFTIISYALGLFLLVTGVKLWFSSGNEDLEDLSESKVIAYIQRKLPKASTFVIAVVCIELMDIVFAMDSIPAILAISGDKWVIYGANLMALLGLRSMYFLVAHVIDRFYYLGHALAVVLTFIGLKMLLKDYYHITTGYSLTFISVTLVVAVVLSITRKGN